MKAHAIRRLRFLAPLFVLAWYLVPANARAQISVGLGSNPVIDFTTTPLATEWATYDSGTGGSTTYRTTAHLDAYAQSLSATSITTALPTTSATGTSRLARHNTTRGELVTQPAGVPAVVLMARLRNDSAGDLELLQVTYSYAVLVTPVTEFISGQRVFWSLTGQPNTWNLIPEFSGVTSNTTLSAVLELGAWTYSGDLYLLWLDDNNDVGQDGAFAIDNVALTGALVTSVTITDQPDALSVPERGTAIFNVSATGVPRYYHWLRDGVPIPGAHHASYTHPSVVYPDDNGPVFTVIVSNQLGSQTSTGAVLTVLPDTNAPVALHAVGGFTRTTATISFSEPIDPATLDASSFLIFPTGTDPQSTGVPATTAVITNATNVVIGFSAAYPADVNHSLLLCDIYDTAHTPNAMTTTTLPLYQILQLIDFNGPNNVWSFSTETNLFGMGWETADYDDTLWFSGPAGLGRDPSNNGVPIRTVCYPFDDSAPQFFRRNFFLNANPANTVLSMRHVFEDGAVVFLNGQEAGRFNVGTGALSVATRTLAGAVEPTPISASVVLPTTNLVGGDNVIAVVVFQIGATSSDCEMALELTATITEHASTPKLNITASGADVAITWNTAGTLEYSTNLASPANWTPVPGSPTSPFTTNTSGPGKFYRVVRP